MTCEHHSGECWYDDRGSLRQPLFVSLAAVQPNHDERHAYECDMATVHHDERSTMNAHLDAVRDEVTARRRTRWFVGAGLAAAAVAAYVAYTAISAGSGETAGAPGSDDSVASLIRITVPSHMRNQAHGTNWSEHRLITIPEYDYVRRAA